MAQKILLGWIAVLSVVTFIVCGIDKFAAQRQNRRVPEKVLFLLAAAGGSIGLYLGMFTFRHKTKHWYFVVGVPAIILAQAALLLYFAARI
mgnify:CR=1